MSILKRLALFVLISLISFSSYCQKKTDTAIAVHYQTEDFDVAIFPASFNYQHGMIKENRRFTPSKQDIDKAENSLKNNLKDFTLHYREDSTLYKNLNGYKRQYLGYIDSNEHRILYINNFGKQSEDSSTWLIEILFIWDQGTNYWRINYDLNSGKFFALQDAGTE